MAAEPKKMTDAEVDRLNALQMADLGTARREHISTADDTHRHIQADMAAIERCRPSNIAGTMEYKQAQMNKSSLDAWTNFHTTVTDTGTREQLDDLMHGQTHRAHLSATLAALRNPELARQPANQHARARSVSHVSNSHPYPRPSSGRGGGIIGARLRHQVSPSRNATHIGGHTGTFDFPTRQDPALDINNPEEATSRSFRGRRVYRAPSKKVSHTGFRARVPEIRPRRPQSSDNYAARLAPPDDFMASIRAHSGPYAVTAKTPPHQPQKAITIPKTATTPETVMVPRPAMTPKSDITANSAKGPKPVAKSSLDDSMYAIPASPTPAARVMDNSPGFPSPSRRMVPFEKTAAFSSRAKAARFKPAGKPTVERQEKSKGDGTAPSLLELGQDVQESAQAQLRDLLLSPGIAADLTGITFPPGDDSASREYNSKLQEKYAEISQTLKQMIEEIEGQPKSQGEQMEPREDLLRRLKESEAQARSMATRFSTLAIGQEESLAKPKAGPNPPTFGQMQAFNTAIPKTEGASAKPETDQVSKSGSFYSYRTPKRSASGSGTDSSNEKRQRRIDASLLSPSKTALASDIPARQFECLRLSESSATQKSPKEPLSLIDMDDDLTPTKEAIVKATTNPTLRLMEESIFATRADKVEMISVRPFLPFAFIHSPEAMMDFRTAHGSSPTTQNTLSHTTDDLDFQAHVTSEENPALSVSKAPHAPTSGGMAQVVAGAQRSALVQSNSNTLKEASAKGSLSAVGLRSSQEPTEKASRAISGGMDQSIWAHTDKGPSKFVPKLQNPPQQHPRTKFGSSRQSGMQSTSAEDTPAPKISFQGPAPYMPRRK